MTTIYHYTNIDSVVGILENGQLHLTHFQYLNDISELIKGIEFFISKSRGHHNDHKAQYTDETLNEVLNALFDMLQSAIEIPKNEIPIYIISFSQEPDLLSQWRAYGKYAIEFNSDEIYGTERNIQTKKCKYTAMDKTQDIGNTFINMAEKINEYEELDNDDAKKQLILDLFVEAVFTSTAFKHGGFKEEKEVRIISGARHPPLFKTKNGLLVPFIELNINPSSIKRILIGPMEKQDLAKHSLDGLIKSLIDQGQIENQIPVEKSTLPFRI